MLVHARSASAVILVCSVLVFLSARSVVGHPASAATAALRREKRSKSCLELKQAREHGTNQPIDDSYLLFSAAGERDKEGDGGEGGERELVVCKARAEDGETEYEVMVVKSQLTAEVGRQLI